VRYKVLDICGCNIDSSILLDFSLVFLEVSFSGLSINLSSLVLSNSLIKSRISLIGKIFVCLVFKVPFLSLRVSV
jgi:hypothetical protein